MSQHTLLPLSSSVRPLLVVFLFLLNMSKNGTQVSSSSVPGASGPRDVLWERGIASLPEPLLRALLDADLGDTLTLQNFPRMEGHLLEEMLAGSLVGAVGTASSDAASSSTGWSTYGHQLPVHDLEWRDEKKGGDPRTDHFSFVRDTGDDPRTVQASFSEQMVDVGDEMAATCPPYRPGRLATETALVPASPALHTDSTDHSHGCVVPDEFPSKNPVLPDGLPSESCVRADGFPSSAVTESSSLLDRILQKNTVLVFYGIFTPVKVRRVSASPSSTKFKSSPLL